MLDARLSHLIQEVITPQMHYMQHTKTNMDRQLSPRRLLRMEDAHPDSLSHLLRTGLLSHPVSFVRPTQKHSPTLRGAQRSAHQPNNGHSGYFHKGTSRGQAELRSGGFAWVGQAAVGKALAARAGVEWLGGAAKLLDG